jgi:hypothetical protein
MHDQRLQAMAGTAQLGMQEANQALACHSTLTETSTPCPLNTPCTASAAVSALHLAACSCQVLESLCQAADGHCLANLYVVVHQPSHWPVHLQSNIAQVVFLVA